MEKKGIKQIRGQVARVLNSRQVAMNVGADDGVTEGMYFNVTNPKGEAITDPATGEPLGSIDLPKIRLRVTLVQEKLSVATTGEQEVDATDESPIMGEFAKRLLAHRFVTKYQTLKSDKRISSEAWEELDEADSYVKVGDPVVQVIREEAL